MSVRLDDAADSGGGGESGVPPKKDPAKKKSSLKPRAHAAVAMQDARLRGRRSGIAMGALDAVKMRQFVRQNGAKPHPPPPHVAMVRTVCISFFVPPSPLCVQLLGTGSLMWMVHGGCRD